MKIWKYSLAPLPCRGSTACFLCWLSLLYIIYYMSDRMEGCTSGGRKDTPVLQSIIINCNRLSLHIPVFYRYTVLSRLSVGYI